jgi:peroxiredoxin
MADILAAGTVAPVFSLHVTPDQKLSLSELRGKPVILAFYPADWSPVCGDQMALYNEILPEFQKYGAELIGVSVDGVWCHEAFAKDRHLHFPLAADFEPKGEVAKSYGAYRAEEGVCERVLFVIDRNGAYQIFRQSNVRLLWLLNCSLRSMNVEYHAALSGRLIRRICELTTNNIE